MRRIVLSLALLAALAACEMPSEMRPEPEEMLTSGDLSVSAREHLWAILEVECQKMGLRMDPQHSDLETGKFESIWSSELSPFRFYGQRKKIVGFIEEFPEGPGGFRIHAIMWKQRNADMDPLNQEEAIWQDLPAAEGAAESQLFIYQVERHFKKYGPSEGFYERSGGVGGAGGAGD